jgi:hypothetical protein
MTVLEHVAFIFPGQGSQQVGMDAYTYGMVRFTRGFT